MKKWGKDNWKEVVMTDIEGIVPKGHLLRKIEKVMDYEWIYARMEALLLRRQRAAWDRPRGIN